MNQHRDTFYKWDGNDLVLYIVCKPGSKKDEIAEVINNELKIFIKEIAEKGKASTYLIAFLAKTFCVNKSSVEIISGEFSVHKQIKIYQPKQLSLDIIKARE